MKEDANNPKSPPPYVAWKTLKNFLRSLVQGVPPQIDKSMMRSLSGGVQSQIIQALKAMRLIDDKGVPSAKMEQLVKAEGDEFKKVLRDVLSATYPFLRSGSFNPKLATMKMLEDEMGKMAGGGTVSKCIAFFIPAAKDAGIELSTYIEKPGKRAATNGKPRKARVTVPGAALPPVPPAPPAAPQSDSASITHLLLAKFPDFDPSWPNEIKAKWFDDFAALRKAAAEQK